MNILAWLQLTTYISYLCLELLVFLKISYKVLSKLIIFSHISKIFLGEHAPRPPKKPLAPSALATSPVNTTFQGLGPPYFQILHTPLFYKYVIKCDAHESSYKVVTEHNEFNTTVLSRYYDVCYIEMLLITIPHLSSKHH